MKNKLVSLVAVGTLALGLSGNAKAQTHTEDFDNSNLSAQVSGSVINYFGFAGGDTRLYRFYPENDWSVNEVGDSGNGGYGVDFSPDGSLYAVGRVNGQWNISEIDVADGRRIRDIPFPEVTEAIAFDPSNQNKVYFVSGYRGIKKFDIDTREVTDIISDTGWGELQAIDFTSDRRFYGISSRHGNQNNWFLEFDPDTGQHIRGFEMPENIPDINSLDIDVNDVFHALSHSPGNVYQIDPAQETVEPIGRTTLGFESLASIPEPSALALLGFGGIGLYGLRRIKR